ncbi:Sodium/hydrogen exchanger 7 [Picochlorum sp. SENEW3]|nr:Sodium/hydrogen exchanger 7 [Picochlorum sp. SENEW3]
MSENVTVGTDGASMYEGSSGAEIVLAVVAAFLFGLLIRTVSNLMPFKWRGYTPLPFTASMLICGALCGFIISNTTADDYMSEGLKMFESINPSVLFAVFLPALITPSGIGLHLHTVSRVWMKAFALAIPGTMINGILVCLVAKYVFPYSWSWSQSFLLGSILSATDPVSVVSIMRSSGSNPELTTVIEGESLLNDGVAYVMFQIFLGWALGQDVKVGSTIGFVFKASLGGPALGIAFALAVMVWLQILFNDTISEITVTLTAAYSLWILSDEVLSLSAVLAVLFYAVFLGAFGKNHVSARSIKAFNFFWDFVDWVANTLIFFLSGLIIAAEISRKSDSIGGKDWGMAFALYFLLLPIRVVGILLLYPILRFGQYALTLKDMVILSWAGLRGAVGLTLALIVYNSADLLDEQFKILCFFFVAMIAVLTLLIQGTSTSMLLKLLGYTKLTPTEKHILYRSAEMIDQIAHQTVEEEKGAKSLLGPADWDLVNRLTSLDVKGQLESRGTKSKGGALGTDTEYQTIHERDLMQDLRERLLRVVYSNYKVAFSQEYLTPSEIMALSNSVEKSEDSLKSPLSDWSALRKTFNIGIALDSPPKATSSFLSRWHKFKLLSKKTAAFLARREGPLQSLAKRSSVMAVTFICAHAAARRHLKVFVEVELSDLEQSGLIRDSSTLNTTSSMPSVMHYVDEDEIEPYWDATRQEEYFELNKTLAEEMPRHESSSGDLTRERSMSFHRTGSVLSHMATNSLILVDDIRKLLHRVLQESRAEQHEAEMFLKQLREVDPLELLEARSEIVSVSVLSKESHMLDYLYKLGLLDDKEVQYAQTIVNSRMKKLHGQYHAD